MNIIAVETTSIWGDDNSSYHQKRRVVKRTRQKEAILNVLSNTTSHPTATWIYDKVRKEIPHVSLGTVYRNLRLLQTQGRISELEIAGCKRFDIKTNKHGHFSCDLCGRVFDVDESESDNLDRDISRKTGFEISGVRLEFHGLCRECQR